ncbi:MAG: hypothetical protein O3A46_17740, partial [Candidatus Poribacteria bacterium]|nr:hypothetical protein [Candidatus Poribacteria bacterium]
MLHLGGAMPKIQTTLASTGTAPPDFTLHDADHAFRVAQRMAEITPLDVFRGLSVPELTVLLLSAYLHDIGMVPDLGHVRRCEYYLQTGDGNALSETQRNELDEWLDANPEVRLPTEQEGRTFETQIEAERAAMFFCRDRHVEWGERWIDDNLTRHGSGLYHGWSADLKRLCRSHHQGYHELVTKPFDPRLVGAPASVLNLRYLAAVLRVADILEFDPERTPEVVFQRRDVHPDSAIYWRRDHEISFSIVEDGQNREFVVSARPPDAMAHRAVLQMVQDIENELHIVWRLKNAQGFECPLLGREPSYRWNILPDVRRDIKPRNNAYVYIDGAFRPNTDRLLELLSGKALYGSPLIAARELLQNAFDAVREQIAYERLRLRSEDDPADSKWKKVLGECHRVELRIEADANDRYWLVCSDGVGMTQEIIENHLLVSGQKHRRDTRRLERLCQERGFKVDRTGQFGIGVLSYFMLADRVEIRTRRSNATDDSTDALRFETEGVGSFGELRPDPTFGEETNQNQGTVVRLRLKPSLYTITPNDDTGICGWSFDLFDYLRETVRRVPCRFKFRQPFDDDWETPTGWTLKPTDYLQDEITNAQSESPQEPIPSFETELISVAQWSFDHDQRELEETFWRRLEQTPNRYDTVEIPLPDELGLCRVHIPLFDLGVGESNVFLLHDPCYPPGEMAVDLDFEPNTFLPKGNTWLSWKGMSFELNAEEESYSMQRERGVLIEIDLTGASADMIRVDRTRLISGSPIETALRFAQQVEILSNVVYGVQAA